jgi:hypothetical protein
MPVRSTTKRLAETIEPEFMSVDQAEIMTGISRWTWRAYAYQGKLESCKVGARLLIPVSEVRRIIAEGTRPRVETKESERGKLRRAV